MAVKTLVFCRYQVRRSIMELRKAGYDMVHVLDVIVDICAVDRLLNPVLRAFMAEYEDIIDAYLNLQCTGMRRRRKK